MITVTFVCLGNICRSPMAEAVFRRLTEEEGLSGKFNIMSRATSDCEEGNPVYYPAQNKLREKGYSFSHRATTLSLADVKNSDYVLVMDKMNYADVTRLCGGDSGGKVQMLGDYLEEKREIDDPWYTRDFDKAFDMIFRACTEFLRRLKSKHNL